MDKLTNYKLFKQSILLVTKIQNETKKEISYDFVDWIKIARLGKCGFRAKQRSLRRMKKWMPKK